MQRETIDLASVSDGDLVLVLAHREYKEAAIERKVRLAAATKFPVWLSGASAMFDRDAARYNDAHGAWRARVDGPANACHIRDADAPKQGLSMTEYTNASQDPGAESVPPPASVRLRLLPAVLAVVTMWAVRAFCASGEPSMEKFFAGFLVAPMAGAAVVVFWWLIFSRAPWIDRLWSVAFVAVASALSIHFAGPNFPAMAWIVYALPAVATIWVGWLTLAVWMSWPAQRLGLTAMLAATFVMFALLRIDGMDGSMAAKFNWRWAPTTEDAFLAEMKNQTIPAATTETAAATLSLGSGDWPAFRGAGRDGRLAGVSIATDWTATPPVKIWSRRVGPGWSSFVVVGDHLFTQEQRGNDEAVVCYDANTGEPKWVHADATRFTEVVAGPGPRATPTFHEGKILSFGANGILNCLDAVTGKRLWSTDVKADTNAKLPEWGFASSPLVVDGLVIVVPCAADNQAVVAYRFDNGQRAWAAGAGSHAYVSAHPAVLAGVPQVLAATNHGLTAFDAATGKILWDDVWECEAARITQPLIVGENDVVYGAGMGVGTRRLGVSQVDGQWTVKQAWEAKRFDPYFNDFVLHEEHIYGYDGPFLVCIDLTTGSERWKKRGYGNGQLLLLADQGLLLILTEQGEIALVTAKPTEHKELARVPAIAGKTWNHPVMAHGKLFARNGEEMACFKLAPMVSEQASR